MSYISYYKNCDKLFFIGIRWDYAGTNGNDFQNCFDNDSDIEHSQKKREDMQTRKERTKNQYP